MDVKLEASDVRLNPGLDKAGEDGGRTLPLSGVVVLFFGGLGFAGLGLLEVVVVVGGFAIWVVGGLLLSTSSSFQKPSKSSNPEESTGKLSGMIKPVRLRREKEKSF